MGATLTYNPRARVISGLVGSGRFFLPTYQDPAAHWEHQYALRPGKYTATDYDFELPSGARPQVGRQRSANTASAMYDGAGTPSPPHLRPRPIHSHSGAAIFISDDQGGFFIHGWPPCNLRRCVVVTHGWDDLFEALGGVDRLLFCIEG